MQVYCLLFSYIGVSTISNIYIPRNITLHVKSFDVGLFKCNKWSLKAERVNG